MWKIPAKERIPTRIVAASAVKSAGLSASTFGLSHHSHRCSDKKKQQQQSSLITEMWQNISGENLRLLHSKMLSIFGSTWATFVNAHFLQCRVSSNTSVRVLSYRLQLTNTTSLCCWYHLHLPMVDGFCVRSHVPPHNCFFCAPFKKNFTKYVPNIIRCFIIGE